MASLEPSTSGSLSLAEAIREVTRPIHKRLDRRIISRLPMALPPLATDPSVYITGLLHIAPIYATFETLWEGIIHSKPTHTQDFKASAFNAQHPLSAYANTDPPLVAVEPPRSNVPERMHKILVRLYLPGLQRSDALRRDLRRLTGWTAKEVDGQLREVASSGELGDFTDLIRKSVEDRPHVLIAYAYILYMALFAGGRFIRAQLESADADFWARVPPEPPRPTAKPCRKPPAGRAPGARSSGWIAGDSRSCPGPASMPMDFFHFDTPRDGLDLKKEFKQRLRDAEPFLTDAERRDVLRVAGVIFEEMLSVVQQLDDLFFTPGTYLADSDGAAAGKASASAALKVPPRDWDPLQPNNLRDSFVVTKERAERKALDGEGDDDDDLSTPFFAEKDDRADEGSLGASGTMRFKTEVVADPETELEAETDGDGGGDAPRSSFGYDGLEVRTNEDGETEELSEYEKALMYDHLVTNTLVVLAYGLCIVSTFFIVMLTYSMYKKFSGGATLPEDLMESVELEL